MARPTLYKDEFCDVVVAAGAEGKTLAEMAAEIGVDRATVRDWVENKPEFSRAVKRGLDKAQAWWESEGRKATFGGSPGFNATSYIFQMKNRFRDDWSDTQRVVGAGPEGEHKHKVSPDESFAEFARVLGIAASVKSGGTEGEGDVG